MHVKELRPTIQEDTQEIKEATTLQELVWTLVLGDGLWNEQGLYCYDDVHPPSESVY